MRITTVLVVQKLKIIGSTFWAIHSKAERPVDALVQGTRRAPGKTLQGVTDTGAAGTHRSAR